jgi:tRNA (guanine-N7-)-methyltransferase
MSRLRKAGKVWQRPGAHAAAERVLFDPRGVFAIDPAAIFARAGALEVEIGAGKGEFIVERAAQFPERNFLAVELSGVICRMLAVRCGRAELGNVRVVRMDARSLVNLMLPDFSVTAFHIYFPDPWPKERHHKHRMVTERIALGLRRTLATGGRLYVATDVPEYADEIWQVLAGAGFVQTSATTPGATATGFGRKFIAARRTVFQGEWKVVNSGRWPCGYRAGLLNSPQNKGN